MNKIILAILLIGIVYRLLLTMNGNFLFNMDNGRDMVDVREMVVLHKLRLTGPTSAIEGLFNGPAWYYLLAIPFMLSGGNPYGSIIMEIVLWAVGGFFLLKLVARWERWLIFPIGSIWIASNYIVLTNLYAFNPNPVLLLTPTFIYLLYKYFETEKLIWAVSSFLMGGLFFNFEMNFGVFILAIILTAASFAGKLKLLKQKSFWVGISFFILTLLPQFLFDIKHGFIMSKSVINFLQMSGKDNFNFINRFQLIVNNFYNVLVPTLFNQKILSWIILGLFFGSLGKERNIKKDLVLVICLSIILVPFLGYLLFPVTVNAWHLGAEVGSLAILIAFLLKSIWKIDLLGKIVSSVLGIFIIILALGNILHFFIQDFGKNNLDPSLYKNEVAAIDYVYQRADGKNFKVYVYLPSVVDYPYQYLIWWYGIKKYGYLPTDYAYAPNKPKYISNKEKFSATENQIKQRGSSNLVFLIKEPNRNYTRFGWEGDFIKFNWQTIEKQMIGSLEIEIRREVSQ